MSTVFALDLGFGNAKACLNGQTAVLQSAVSRPRAMGKAALGMKVAARVPTIHLEGRTFALGRGAWQWGDLLTSGDYSALATPERRALAFGALAQLLPPGEHEVDLMVIGLPVPLLQDAAQAEALLASLKAYKGRHTFRLGAQRRYTLHIRRLKALAQPVGTYADWLLDEGLRARPRGRRAEVAVLDLGMNTLDLYTVQGGQVTPRFIGGDKVGVRRLLELVQADGHDLEELDDRLRRGRLRPTPSQWQSWLAEVLAVVERVWPNLRRFDAVIPSGGGSLILGERLRTALIAKGAALYWPEDPLTANVRGLWKWGAHGLHRGAA